MQECLCEGLVCMIIGKVAVYEEISDEVLVTAWEVLTV